ncbi:hypothetical protein DXG01_004007 [Tephrocybe rancida]|nr:hypothetical protein DXG01_004007 [Tephrocybe rancida]
MHMPIHMPDTHKFVPEADEKIIALVKNYDRQKQLDYLDLTTGFNEGIDPSYWKDSFRIKDLSTGQETLCCPGLMYPYTLTTDEVWSRIAARLTLYVFLTPTNWRPDPDDADDETVYRTPPVVYSIPRRDEEGKYGEDRASRSKEQVEHCAMCADRLKYWAVSPPVFLSRHSRKWHIHVDCLQHFMPRRQFGLKPVKVVDFV